MLIHSTGTTINREPHELLPKEAAHAVFQAKLSSETAALVTLTVSRINYTIGSVVRRNGTLGFLVAATMCVHLIRTEKKQLG